MSRGKRSIVAVNNQPAFKAAVSETRRLFLTSLAAGSVVAMNARLDAQETARPLATTDVPWLSRVQTKPPSLPKDAPKLQSLLTDGATAEAWERQRRKLRDDWLGWLGPLATAARPRQPAFRVLDEERRSDVVRQRIEYTVQPGVSVQAYLLKPARVKSTKLPGVAVFHSTVNHSIRQPAGLQGRPEKFFGLWLARRGCVTICPRNYLWPDNDHIAANEETRRFERRHPDSRGMARMLRDSQIAVDLLAAQPEVDADRLGAVGHSLGAKEVLYLAAFDERIRATVSSEGGIGTQFSNWDAPWYLGPDIRQPQGRNREHHELLAMVAPRAFLLMGGDSADGDRSWPFIECAMPVYRLYADTPRLGLLNHGQGHSVPPLAERFIYEWFDAYL